jgi:cell division transport system permease protein
MSWFKDDLKSFKRSWVHHTGMQLATFSVLTATFSVVALVLSLSLNVNRLLASWGETVQLTAYLEESVTPQQVTEIQDQLRKLPAVEAVTHVPREVATANFKSQMASYAPDLLTDADFANPFPASFRVTLNGGVHTEKDFATLEKIASAIGKVKGIEDVSYGQTWVKSYSTFVSALAASGGAMILILLAGGLFVVGNSVRAAISARKEEIEILELIGATATMIRRPYIVEGAAMGFAASIVSLGVCFGIQAWQISLLSKNVELARLAHEVTFLGVGYTLLFIVAGTSLGAIAAWGTVRKINDGWAALQRQAS